MKRTITLILSTLLIIQSFAFCLVSADEPVMDTIADESVEEVVETEVYEPYIKSERILKAIGAIKTEYDYEEELTRGKAVKLIIEMLKEDNHLQSFRGLFNDVSEKNEYALYIEKATDLGIVKGSGGFIFRPDDLITYNEAYSIMSNVLGFGLISDTTLTYAQVVVRQGITKNIRKKYAVVNVGDFFVMMINALMSEVMERASYSTNGGTFEMSEKILMNMLYDVKIADGIIIKNDLTYLNAAGDGDKEHMIIKCDDNSRHTIRVNDFEDVRDDLGKDIKLYYMTNNDTNENEYVYHEVEGACKSILINIDKLEENTFLNSGGKVEYYPEFTSEKREIRLADTDQYTVIYNNVRYKNNMVKVADLSGMVGTVEFIDAKADGIYETVKIKVYKSIMVGSVSPSNKVITDKYDSSRRIDVDEDDFVEVLIYNENGIKASIENILVGNIVSFAKSESRTGEDVVELRVSTKTHNGKITGFKLNKDFSPIIEIDHSKTYNLYDRAAWNYSVSPIVKKQYNIGDNILYYVDVFGYIVYVIDDNTRDMHYGIITDIGKDGSTLEPEIWVKLISASGEKLKLQLDDRPVIDGKVYETTENHQAYDAINNQMSNTYGSYITTTDYKIAVVRYKINDENKVKVIDTVADGKLGQNDRLEIRFGQFGVKNGNIFGWTIPFEADAEVLEIPMNENPSDESSVIGSGIASEYFKAGSKHQLIACKSSDEKEYDFIIEFDFKDNSAAKYLNLFVIDEKISEYNSRYDVVMDKLIGYTAGIKKEIWLKESYTGEYAAVEDVRSMKKGDVIMPLLTVDNYLINCVKVATTSGTTTPVTTLYGLSENVISDTDSAQFAMVHGYVVSNSNGLISTTKTDAGTSGTKILDTYEASDKDSLLYHRTTTGAPVVVYDQTKDKMYVGSFNDVKDYENYTTECSRVMMRYRSGNLAEVIIYNP